VLAALSVTSSVSQPIPPAGGEIPTVIGARVLTNINMFHGHRDSCVTIAETVPRHSGNDDTRLALFNARSIGDKSAAASQQWISDMKLDLAALVETWHDK